jgi:hypothetical protein
VLAPYAAEATFGLLWMTWASYSFRRETLLAPCSSIIPMDVQILHAVAEVLVMTIPVIVVAVGGVLLVSRSRIGVALARRIAGDSQDPACQEQLDALQDEILGLRNQITEVQDRVDFAERLLGRAAETRGE